jgi:hypothetical protein
MRKFLLAIHNLKKNIEKTTASLEIHIVFDAQLSCASYNSSLNIKFVRQLPEKYSKKILKGLETREFKIFTKNL